jgi:hypothetical protein
MAFFRYVIRPIDGAAVTDAFWVSAPDRATADAQAHTQETPDSIACFTERRTSLD